MDTEVMRRTMTKTCCPGQWAEQAGFGAQRRSSEDRGRLGGGPVAQNRSVAMLRQLTNARNSQRKLIFIQKAKNQRDFQAIFIENQNFHKAKNQRDFQNDFHENLSWGNPPLSVSPSPSLYQGSACCPPCTLVHKCLMHPSPCRA